MKAICEKCVYFKEEEKYLKEERCVTSEKGCYYPGNISKYKAGFGPGLDPSANMIEHCKPDKDYRELNKDNNCRWFKPIE